LFILSGLLPMFAQEDSTPACFDTPDFLRKPPQEAVISCIKASSVRKQLREQPLQVDYSRIPSKCQNLKLSTFHPAVGEGQQDTIPSIIEANTEVLSDSPLIKKNKEAGQEKYDQSELFIQWETQPYLKSCDGLPHKEQWHCSGKRLLEFVYSNFSFDRLDADTPDHVCILQFKIKKDGNIGEVVNVLRAANASVGQAALRLHRLLQQSEEIKWVPGKVRDKAVEIQYNLPIKVKCNQQVEPIAPKQDTIADHKNYRCLSISKPIQEGKPKAQKFLTVDEFPYLCACDSLKQQGEKKACTEQKITEYIKANLQYPYTETGFNPENKVLVARFTIEKNGQIGDVQIVRNIGPGFGQAAQYMLRKMRWKKGMQWKPGQHQGKPVQVAVNLPIYYEDFEYARATYPALPPPPPPPPPKPGQEEIFRVVEEMPRFPGCEDLPKTERKACADRKLLEFIHKQIRYPEIAVEKGLRGRALVQFVVEKNGDISNVKVLEDPGYGLDEEVKRAVEEMNRQGLKWIPGPSRGRAVRVQFNLPVKFELGR